MCFPTLAIQWASQILLQNQIQMKGSKNKNESRLQYESQKCESFIDLYALFNYEKCLSNETIMTLLMSILVKPMLIYTHK